MDNPNEINYFAETDSRNRRVTFGIKSDDRTKHVYVIGKTGMGKSTLLENMAAQDVRNGNGFAFLDPHGSAVETILKYIPKERIEDVIYFAPFDMEHPISFNVMEDVGFDKRHLVVSGLMSTFKKIWQDAWSARMEYILGNTLLALLEYPNATLLEVNKMLSDKDFRKKVVDNVTDSSVKSFWVDEFAKYTDRFAAEATPAIQNKIGQFTANPLIRNIIGQPKSSFDLRDVMDNKKILIVNLSKGRIGESNANLLGSMLITKLYLAALSRADKSKDEMKTTPNFYLYVDEFQSFANESFADILSEARKYKLNLTIAHQYIEQMSDEVRAAVFGNVGTMISFRVGSFDAEVLEKEFAPTFTAEDIVNLGFAQIYLRLMINGIGSQPFSARTLPPLERPEVSFVEEIIGASRRKYTKDRVIVEDEIRKLHAPELKQYEEKAPDKKGGKGGDFSHKPKQHNDGGDYKPKPRPVIDKQVGEEIKKMIPQAPVVRDEKPREEVRLSDMTLQTRAPQKKFDKTPSVENKNTLRNALAGILGDLKTKEGNVTSGTAVVSKPAPLTQAAQNNVQNVTVNIAAPEQKQNAPVENVKPVQQVARPAQSIRPVELVKKIEEIANVASVHEKKEEVRKEIPEDELRKILEV